MLLTAAGETLKVACWHYMTFKNTKYIVVKDYERIDKLIIIIIFSDKWNFK